MKKIILYFLLITMAVSCKKAERTPEGPTDIRIRNLSDLEMVDLTVNTSGGENNFGTIAPGATTEYFRFDKAYSKANIRAIISGQVFRTDTVKESDYLYYNYIGPNKATYEVYIENALQRKLKIFNVIMEEPLE